MPTNPIARHRSRSQRTEPHLGFTLQLEPRPGAPLRELRTLERSLEDYALAHELVLSGHQLHFVVTAAERSLTAADQVGLLNWLIDQSGHIGVRVSPLTRRPAGASPQDGYLHARVADVAMIGLTILYRCGRVAPELYLQILGGFVRPAQLH